MVKKVGPKYEFPDGTKAFEKAINKTPSKFFTDDFLKLLDVHVQKKFQYGGPTIEEADAEDEADEE